MRQLALACGLLVAGIAGCHRGSSAGPSVKPEPTASASSARTAVLDPRIALGRAAFTKYCALCHGADARGYAADHAPSLVSETFLATATDEFLSTSIRDGRPGTAMAGYGKERGGPLAPEEIGQIMAFLRAGRTPPGAFPPPRRAGDAAAGKPFYEAACQRCHGTKEARGEAVHLANQNFLSSASDSFLRYAVANGRPGTPMQPFAGTLLDPEIDDVIAYVRTFGPAGPAATPPGQPPELPPDNGPVVINPKGKPPSFTLREERFVPAEQVKKALEAKNRIVIIDARAASDWINVHIPGSISVPYYALSRLDALPKDGTWVVAYCACPHHASGVIVDELRKRGFTHTAVLDEGILEWQKRNYPIEPPKK